MLEDRGIPTAAIGPDKLVLSIGTAMARRHGFNDYPFVVIDYPYAESLTTESLELHRQKAWPQIESVLLERDI